MESGRPGQSGRREEFAVGLRPAGRPARVVATAQAARLALRGSRVRGTATLGGQAAGFGALGASATGPAEFGAQPAWLVVSLEAHSRLGAIALLPARTAEFAERRVEPH